MQHIDIELLLLHLLLPASQTIDIPVPDFGCLVDCSKRFDGIRGIIVADHSLYKGQILWRRSTKVLPVPAREHFELSN